MSKVCQSILVMVIFYSFGPLYGQETTTNKKSEFETAARFRRLSEMLRFVHRQSMQGNSNLDLVDFQLEKLANIRSRYLAAVTAFAEVENENATAGLPPLIQEVEQLDHELSQEILVDGQYELARNSVFLESLEKAGGNFVAVLFDNYLDEIGLTEKQFKQITDLRKTTDQRLYEAKQKYEREVRAILDASKKDFSSMLNDSQKGILEIGK